MSSYLVNLTETIKRHSDFGDREQYQLQHIVESWPYDSREMQIKKFEELFPGNNKEDYQDRDYKAYNILSLLDKDIKSVLDIGAGQGQILSKIIQENPNTKGNAYALEYEDKIKVSGIVNKWYNSDNKIPLEDSSIDLVIIASTLHHIGKTERDNLLSEVKRLLSANGVVIVQEHAYDNTSNMYMFLDILHNYWYSKGEKVDPMYLLTQQEVQEEFRLAGMSLVKKTPIVGWQRLYWDVYTSTSNETDCMFLPVGDKNIYEIRQTEWYKNIILEQNIEIKKGWRTFTEKDTMFNEEGKSLVYQPLTSRIFNTPITKWGQLKLFVVTLQVILRYWDKNKIPKLTIVYAGAAHGYNVAILSEMFPDIVWDLYDMSPFGITQVEGKINLFTGQVKGKFTNEVAAKYAGRNDIFFMSDIRRSKDEKLVEEDMNMQMEWTKIINPQMSILKMRLPYIDTTESTEDKIVTYLDGEIMLQPFIGFSSSETRLISTIEDGKYKTKEYSSLEYQDKMFYHNTITRKVVRYNSVYGGKVVDDGGYMNNNYDCIFFLNTLKEYIIQYKIDEDPLTLSWEIRDRINTMMKKKYPVMLSR